MANQDEILMRLVDWVYLHATEGGQWPSTTSKITLVMLAKDRAPSQKDAEMMKIHHVRQPT